MTEKRRPHYPLARIKELIADPKTRRITVTARRTAARLDIQEAGIVACVLELEPACFYKSMTTHYDHTAWQDVYLPTFEGIELYVKVQIDNDQTVVISFKLREDER